MKIMAIAVMTVAVGMSARAERNVTIYVSNDVNTWGALYQAQERAAKMFAEAGVRLQWRTGHPSGAQPEREQAIVVSLAENTPASYQPRALAFAQVYEGVHITVFWDRVERMSRFAPPTFVLAHVLVHEITHILQGFYRHSESGIMKAQWTVEDYHAMAEKPLPFTPEDVQLIQLGLARRTRRGSDGPHEFGSENHRLSYNSSEPEQHESGTLRRSRRAVPRRSRA
jgi:hypothetical protein